MAAIDFGPLLDVIDPDESYGTWTTVGMALKHEGLPVSVWIDWSRRGAKFNEGECEKKWESFREDTDTVVTGATITQMAKDRGFQFGKSKALNLSDKLTDMDFKLLDGPVVDARIEQPYSYDPKSDMKKYLTVLFKPDEHVSIASSAFQDDDGKYKPIANNFARTREELINRLNTMSIEMAIGSTGPGGAWVRINPMKETGGKNEDVTAFRYGLIESDTIPPERQLALIHKLKLPCAAIVFSGGKSVHAIVHVDASSPQEYRERIRNIYNICQKNGFPVDTQNKNPSRYSRLPGVQRGDKMQFAIEYNVGEKDYESWIDWVNDEANSLPEIELFDEEMNENLPPLKPELIYGLLRHGHKMLLTAGSKAGKSMALMELAVRLTSGTPWMKWQCAPSSVLYVNLEIDPASFKHRLHKIYKALGLIPNKHKPLYIWDLRGHSMPMDKLAAATIRKAAEYHVDAIIIDPLYKALMGDENSASDIAALCNALDVIANKLGASVIYAHHHAKGAQGSRAVLDRGSGSGVFARDADAILDMTRLDVDRDPEDKTPGPPEKPFFAYRVNVVAREFPPIEPFEVVFDFPLHKVDKSGFLKMAAEVGSIAANQKKGRAAQTSKADNRRREIQDAIEDALENGESITVTDLSEQFGVSARTIRNDIAKINSEEQTYKIAMGPVPNIENVRS